MLAMLGCECGHPWGSHAMNPERSRCCYPGCDCRLMRPHDVAVPFWLRRCSDLPTDEARRRKHDFARKYPDDEMGECDCGIA